MKKGASNPVLFREADLTAPPIVAQQFLVLHPSLLRLQPHIELQVKESGKMIDHLLKSTGYTKHKDSYEKGSPYADRKTVCTITSSGKYKILSFSKIKTASPQN